MTRRYSLGMKLKERAGDLKDIFLGRPEGHRAETLQEQRNNFFEIYSMKISTVVTKIANYTLCPEIEIFAESSEQNQRNLEL